MPIKIDVQSNVDDCELTIDKCSEIITVLQSTYQNIRKDLYNHFLGMKALFKALIFSVFLLGLYFLTEDSFFIYFMPISVVFSMITSIVSAEYFTSQTRKQIQKQLQLYIEKRDRLLKKQKIKV